MKRLISIVLVVLLLTAMPVYATESPNEEEDISYTVNEKITLRNDSTVTVTVVSGSVISCVVDGKVIPQYNATTPKYEFRAEHGTHTILLNCTEEVDYTIEHVDLDINPYLAYESITLVQGFTAENHVVNANSFVEYKSSNPDIFTVDDNGNITTVSAGTADFVCYVGTEKLTCPVKVKKNVYKASALKTNECPAFTTTAKVTSVAYTDKGATVKINICNNTPYAIKKLKPTFTLKDDKGSKLLVKKYKTLTKTILPYRAVTINLDVTNKSLPSDLINLTVCKPSVSVKYSYKN